MSVQRQQLGRAGEQRAADFLRRAGYRILASNYRTRRGELDLVAEEGGELVFVEVKTRTSLAFGSPAEAVDSRKQRRIGRAAQEYLLREGASERAVRFDVVAISLAAGRPEIEIIKNAFEYGG